MNLVSKMKMITALCLVSSTIGSAFAFTNPSLKGSWQMDKMKRSYLASDKSKVITEKLLFSDTIGNNGAANYEGQYFTELIFADDGRVLVNYTVAATQKMPLNGADNEVVIGNAEDSVYTSLIIEKRTEDKMVLSRRIDCSKDIARCPEGVSSVKEFYFYSPIEQAVLDELKVSEKLRSMDKEVDTSSGTTLKEFSEVKEF